MVERQRAEHEIPMISSPLRVRTTPTAASPEADSASGSRMFHEPPFKLRSESQPIGLFLSRFFKLCRFNSVGRSKGLGRAKSLCRQLRQLPSAATCRPHRSGTARYRLRRRPSRP